MNTHNFKMIIAGGALAFAALISMPPTAQASQVSITSEDGYIDVIGFTNAQECTDKYYEQCITIHPNCGGARIYVGKNISKILHYWNSQGKNYNIGPNKHSTPYCRTRDM